MMEFSDLFVCLAVTFFFISPLLVLKEPAVPEGSGAQGSGSLRGRAVSAGCDELRGACPPSFFQVVTVTGIQPSAAR